MRPAPALTLVTTAAVTVLATARLTRFLTTDYLGEWTIVGPAKRWAYRHDTDAANYEATLVYEREKGYLPTPSPKLGWHSKAVSIFDCGYCLSPWIGGGILIASAVAPKVPVARHVVPWLLKTLATSYVVGHVWNRLDNQ